MTDTPAKATRKHVNVSRVVMELDGQRYRFNLTRGGLVIRRWRSRRPKTISFSALLDLSIEQKQLW